MKSHKFPFFHISTFLYILMLYGCSVVPDKMKTAEQLLETAPDSALQILQHISPDRYKSGSNRAFYSLLLIKALDKNYLPLKPDSLLDFSLNYYQSHHHNDHLAECYLYKGRMYKNVLQYEKAMSFYLKALDVTKNSNNNVILARINYDLGEIQLTQGDYYLSREKYNLAYKYFTKVGLQNQAFFALINIGRSFHAAKEYKNAQNYFHKTLPYAKDSLQKGSLLQEIAINFYDYHKFDSAKVYFNQVIKYPYIGNNRAIRYYYFADLLFDLNQIDSAGFYAKNSFNYKPDIRTKLECYRILVNVAGIKNDLEALRQNMTHYQQCSDSIRKIDAETKGSILETIHYKDIEVVNTKNKFWYLFAFFLFVVTSMLLFYLKRNKRIKSEKLQLEEKQLKQKVITRKEIVFKHRDTLLKKIESIKADQTVERKKASPVEKEILDRNIYKEIIHINDINFFHQEMDTVLNNLVTKLKTNYPSLNEKEICWCCLSMLKIPTSDIYLLLDYKVTGLKKMKQRLSQKFNLSGATELNTFLIKLLVE